MSFQNKHRVYVHAAGDTMPATSRNDSRRHLGRQMDRSRLGVGTLSFWGLFFIEHTAEWFTHPNQWPPLHVTLLHAAHLVFLLGLLAGWRWELIGGVVVLVAAVMVFSASEWKERRGFPVDQHCACSFVDRPGCAINENCPHPGPN